MITRNTKLLIITVLSITASVTGAILTTIYMQQVAIAQNRTGSTGAGVSLNNLTGSVQVFPGLSQTIQSKAKISLSTAATIAEKSVNPSSHAVSAHVGIKNGYLVYSVRILDSNNNLHWIIVDAGNGKVLLSQQLPFGNPVIP
ncbi:MAG TPA: PepSY domain-containing protein [Candidatus Eisenbacteria bacterium]|nr:PepSY domain-containing protein [Candidatus Eisenbacteria bacterium]